MLKPGIANEEGCAASTTVSSVMRTMGGQLCTGAARPNTRSASAVDAMGEVSPSCWSQGLPGDVRYGFSQVTCEGCEFVREWVLS